MKDSSLNKFGTQNFTFDNLIRSSGVVEILFQAGLQALQDHYL